MKIIHLPVSNLIGDNGLAFGISYKVQHSLGQNNTFLP